MVKKIAEKQVGTIKYGLRFFEGDGKYVIYRMNLSLMRGDAVRIPEEAVFDTEKEAREYLEQLGEGNNSGKS